MAIDNLEQFQRGGSGVGTTAVRIPVYQQRTSPNGQLNVRASAPQQSDAVGRALSGFGNSIGQFADYQIAQEQQRLKLEANAAYAQDAEKLGTWYLEQNQAIQKGGVGFTDQIKEGLDKHIAEATKDKPEFYKQEYERHMRARHAQLVQQAKISEIQEGARYKLEAINTDVQSTVNTLAKDPSDVTYQAELKRLSEVVDSDPSLRVDVKEKAKENIKQQLSWAVSVKKAEQAAKAGVAAGEKQPLPAGGQGGFDSAVSFTLKHEGGLNPKDTNGTPSNFGINQKANPDVDVKNLTREQATKIYRDKYWNAIGGDALAKTNPALATAAFDTAVLAGPGKAKELLDQAGGDMTKFMDLREKFLSSLAARDPEKYGKYVGAWGSRNAELRQQTGGAPTGGVKVAAGPGADLATIIGPAFSALPFDKQQAVQQHYEQQFKHNQVSQMANISIQSATTAVNSMLPQSPDELIDVPRAKVEAVRLAEEQNGGPLEPAKRYQVETQVEKVVSDIERDRKRSVANDVQSGFDTLDKNGGDYQALVRDNPTLMSRIGRDNIERMQKYAGEVATGHTRATDWQSYNTLINDPATLKSTNLDALRDKFNAKEFDQLKTLQHKLLTATEAQDNIQSNLTVVKTMLGEAGVKDDKKEAKFFSLLQSAIDQELAATGKKALTQQRTKELAADLLVQEITSKGILWDSKERAFNVTVPPAERVKIEAALKESGLPVTDYNVLNAYRKKLQRPSVLQK